MSGEALLRVLLVEDSIPVRSRVRRLIRESSTSAIVGETGTVAEARLLLAKEQPEVVLMDLQLADGSALPLLQEIKTARRACVVIVLTSFSSVECRDMCERLGADYFFEKSSEFERVPEVLASILRGRTGSAASSIQESPRHSSTVDGDNSSGDK